MTIKTLINSRLVIPVDLAALVAAGICPADVENSVDEAKDGNYIGWQMAATVRDALLANLQAGSTDPAPVAVTYVSHENWGESHRFTVTGAQAIAQAIAEHGRPLDASFERLTLWQWIAKNVALSGCLHELITEAIHQAEKRPAPETNAPDYLDPNHGRYSPKLAAAVNAWLKFQPIPGKSTKQALENWLRTNARDFDATGFAGNAITSMAAVANWDASGGAPKTPIQV